ncbi:MAG TPA: alcohol dehydrogenase catalytic domain-containing protein [Pyrinomonadaceae bacterium]|nr:alcohol dehydrogenase catalytic domain-containing protein [Pyrinomonadaceae bacterium]
MSRIQALVKYESGVGHVELRDVEEPRCGDDQVKIQVSYCGVCGTDLHVYEDTFRNYPPVILGHEFSGQVVETGKNVSHVACGDPVTVLPASAVMCGSCAYCRTGHFMFCSQRRGMGHGINGAFAEYAVVRKDQAYKIPQDLTLAAAALSEPFAAAVQAVTEITKVRLGDVVLISGPGPMGLLCLKLLVAEGIKTIVAGTSADALRLEAAHRIGASVIVDTSREDLAGIVAEETRGAGVDVAFECSGAGPSARNCLHALKPLGQYTQVGIFGKEVSLEFDLIFYKQLRVAGSVAYSMATWERLQKILDQGAVRLDDLVTHTMPLAQWRDAFDLCLNKQAIKVLLSPATL